jgi:hypothetical protein
MAGAVVMFAVAISPIGIRVATGRPELAQRVNVISLTFVVVLLIFTGGLLAPKKARHAFFHLLAWSFPFALLAAVETGANYLQLADTVAPLQNLSILAHNGRVYPEQDFHVARVDGTGLGLYRPFRGDSITINEFGLRTAPPSPKRAGEWRIAVTGGSAAWGWRMADVDTIPVELQQILHRQGLTNVTIYNFAIEGQTIAEEFDVLRRFRELYSIDQVVSYTGANDATSSYVTETLYDLNVPMPLTDTGDFELIKTARRLHAMLFGPSKSVLAKLAAAVSTLSQHNSLRNGVLGASQYCRAVDIYCDFVLQPMLLTRKMPRGQEIRITKTLNRIYPRYDAVIKTMYRSALNTGLPVDDMSDVFDQSVAPYFVDAVHVNEAGNRLVAERIAEIVAAELRRLGNRKDERQ